MSLSTYLTHFGKRFTGKRLHAGQIGAFLACYNLGLIFALVVLCLVSINSSLWAYLLLLSPFAFGTFWLWFSQVILRYYPRMPIHDAVVIAKVGALPFVLVFVASVIGLAAAASVADIPGWWTVGSYYGVVFGGGSIGLELTLVVFGLRHKLPIRAA